MQLAGPQVTTKSGKDPRQLVVFLHGYGANGDDLIDLYHS
jgi:phospholipase/carboxylesterase